MSYEKGKELFKEWKYERFLGEGGFGRVYLVRNKVGIPKALKVLHSDVNLKDGTRGSDKEIRGVRDVMELAASSPRLVTIEDFGQTVDGQDCILMEYIPRSLEDELKGGKLPEDQAVHWFEELLKGLEVLEGNSLVHRDLKPANLFVKDDVLVIGDFGSLKYTSGYSSGMSQGVGMTLEYTPPEKYQNQAVSFAGDRWAAAVILYKMLSGAFPFTGDTPFAIMNAVNFNEPDLSLVPQCYHEFLKNCFVKNVEEREKVYSGMQAMLAGFRACFKNKPEPVADKQESKVRSKKTKSARQKSDSKLKTAIEPEAGTVWKDLVLGMEFVWVPAGTFNMGSDAYRSERPLHEVTLSQGFWMGRYQVTQVQWQQIMGSNPSKFKGENLPVENVNWDHCHDFIGRLNKASSGIEYKLPTEAQWEYAARGGPLSRGYKYSGSNNLDDVAWYGNNSGRKTHDVGTKQPNELGIYDMSGNVYEWCLDGYEDYPKEAVVNFIGSGSKRVSRGGCWCNVARCCRCTSRYNGKPGFFNLKSFGFRLLCLK